MSSRRSGFAKKLSATARHYFSKYRPNTQVVWGPERAIRAAPFLLCVRKPETEISPYSIQESGNRKDLLNITQPLAIKLPVIGSPDGLRTLEFGHNVYLARNFTFANIVDKIGDTFY